MWYFPPEITSADVILSIGKILLFQKKKKVAEFIRSRSLVKMEPGIVNQSRAEVEAGNL